MVPDDIASANPDDNVIPTDGDDDGPIACWCGATGTYTELFDDAHLDAFCGGSGVLTCHCGGDVCVCHHHGETECFGCADCDGDDEENDSIFGPPGCDCDD